MPRISASKDTKTVAPLPGPPPVIEAPFPDPSIVAPSPTAQAEGPLPDPEAPSRPPRRFDIGGIVRIAGTGKHVGNLGPRTP
jgi:hypothetical protein